MIRSLLLLALLIATLLPFGLAASGAAQTSAPPVQAPSPAAPTAQLFPLTSVRLLPGPFTSAVAANRAYMLALDPDRLLAPFRREAGLEPRKPSYGNWENGGLDGHIAGHYLSALANMVASGSDNAQGELRRRLNYMVGELELCQRTYGDGYIGGVPGSRALWKDVAAGRIESLDGKWVPWYNLHKTFAGLRDAYLIAGNQQARTVLVRFGDWCERVTAKLPEARMQQMLNAEHGGMNEVLADIYAMTGDKKYLNAAQRFTHRAVVEPLERQEDRLTNLHANTQIPKIIGLERIATLTGDAKAAAGARFFWDTVTRRRSVAFGGNSVSEHFNDPANFRVVLEHREGPETCNSYNMLRLTEQLFAAKPEAAFADYYERTLFNHLLSAINPDHPGYVYFTPIRPGHYRVYSQPDQGMWCCVGTGMENPGKYGEFIYARAADGLYVNLFVASELSAPQFGLVLRQDTAFPDEAGTRLTLRLKAPAVFTLRLRHPAWVERDAFAVRVNGSPVAVSSAPSSYAEVRREWRDGDRVEIALPMRDSVERLPDGSDWVAFLHGPIVLASPDGTDRLDGLRAGAGRGDHIAGGPLVPLDRMPVLLASAEELPKHLVPEPAAGPLHFRLAGVSDPVSALGLPLVPFFRLHDARYQMYWAFTTKEGLAARQEHLAAEERAKLAREAETIDLVAIGEQQPEVDHAFSGERTQTALFNGRRYRDGVQFQYRLSARGAAAADLAVTYWGGDSGRVFDISVNDKLLATERLDNPKPGEFIEKRYPLPPEVLGAAPGGAVTVKFVAKTWVAGGVYDLRLLRPKAPEGQTKQP